MADIPGSRPHTAFRKRLVAVLNHNWTITVLGGLLLALLTPVVTGFVNLSFSTRSWEVFGAANEAGAPGAYLAANSVYRLPVGERFRVDGDLLLAVTRDLVGTHASLTLPNGKVYDSVIHAARSLSVGANCKSVAVHLMRQPNQDDTEVFVMYTSQDLDTDECRGFFSKLVG